MVRETPKTISAKKVAGNFGIKHDKTAFKCVGIKPGGYKERCENPIGKEKRSEVKVLLETMASTELGSIQESALMKIVQLACAMVMQARRILLKNNEEDGSEKEEGQGDLNADDEPAVQPTPLLTALPSCAESIHANMQMSHPTGVVAKTRQLFADGLSLILSIIRKALIWAVGVIVFMNLLYLILNL